MDIDGQKRPGSLRRAVPSMETIPGVLVTGASSGIGLATARLLSRSGMQVFAGVRRLSGTPKTEATAMLHEIVLDVTKPDSVFAARSEIEARLNGGGLFAVVNNAGMGDIVPLEFAPMERLRRIFEVNVFGLLAVTQAFLPLLHRGKGRIVNIGSVGGMVTIPFGSPLTASKHAVESISDALRLELHAAGIPVTCIQPASINSGAAEKLAAEVEATIASLPPEGRRRYGDPLRGFVKAMLKAETGGSPPGVVAEAVLKVLRAKKPPARRLAGKHGGRMKFLARGIPDSCRDALFRRLFLGNPAFGGDPGRPES